MGRRPVKKTNSTSGIFFKCVEFVAISAGYWTSQSLQQFSMTTSQCSEKINFISSLNWTTACGHTQITGFCGFPLLWWQLLFSCCCGEKFSTGQNSHKRGAWLFHAFIYVSPASSTKPGDTCSAAPNTSLANTSPPEIPWMGSLPILLTPPRFQDLPWVLLWQHNPTLSWTDRTTPLQNFSQRA